MIDRDLLGQMIVDILNERDSFIVLVFFGRKPVMRSLAAAAEVDEQLHQAHFGTEILTVRLAAQHALDREEHLHEFIPLHGIGTQNVASALRRLVEAAVELRVSGGLLSEVFRIDVEDDALVTAGRVDIRLVDRALAYEHDVVRLQSIALAFDIIVSHTV